MKVTDESTIVLNGAPAKANVKSTSKKGSAWKDVLIGGVPGILLGSGGTVFAHNFHVEETKDQVEEVANEEVADDVAEIEASVPAAGNVDDSMTFSEAFESAREEVGPGGVFTWNGNLYSTYYQEEWDSMTDEQKQEFADSIYNNPDLSEIEVIDDTEYSDPVEDYNDVPVEEGQIEVIAEEVIETADGEIRVTCVEMDGHYGEIYDYANDGQPDAALWDTNDDGMPDLAIVDENGDGYISENEVQILENHDMLAMGSSPEDALYNDMPDYTNDADTSSFV